MKTFLQILGIIAGIIIVGLSGFAIYAKTWWDDIIFKPDIAGIKSKLPSIIAGLITNQKLPISVLVDNNNSTGLSVKNFQIKAAYEGTGVFQSAVIPVVAIPANAKNYPINGELELFANGKTIKLANELIGNSQPTIDLTVTLTKFGITRSFTFPYQIKF